MKTENMTPIEELIEAVKAAGFRAFMRKPLTGLANTYLYFTDGRNIGYAQYDFHGFSLSTVHIPSRANGAGFRIEAGSLSKHELEKAFVSAPAWAGPNDRGVQKYSSLESFLKANSWGGGLHEVF